MTVLSPIFARNWNTLTECSLYILKHFCLILCNKSYSFQNGVLFYSVSLWEYNLATFLMSHTSGSIDQIDGQKEMCSICLCCFVLFFLMELKCKINVIITIFWLKDCIFLIGKVKLLCWTCQHRIGNKRFFLLTTSNVGDIAWWDFAQREALCNRTP